jgi:imidazolonepropionase-like amidohydrolase
MPNEGLAEASTADELVEIGRQQLDDGADLIKVYLDGPEPNASPWTPDELRPLVAMAHEHGVKVTAHSRYVAGARAGVRAGIDSIEHGTELDADLAREMAAKDIALVTTLAVFRSYLGFGTTTRLPRFADPGGTRAVLDEQARAIESVRLAHAAGVRIATGTDCQPASVGG